MSREFGGNDKTFEAVDPLRMNISRYSIRMLRIVTDLEQQNDVPPYRG